MIASSGSSLRTRSLSGWSTTRDFSLRGRGTMVPFWMALYLASVRLFHSRSPRYIGLRTIAWMALNRSVSLHDLSSSSLLFFSRPCQPEHDGELRQVVLELGASD